VYNKAVYTHTHLLADGTIITHAHPYTKTNAPGPVTNHSHTQNQLFLLSVAELLFFFFVAALILIFRNNYTLFSETPVSFYFLLSLNRLKNKSPPFLCKAL
jgi:hypothetical protein